MNRGSTATAFAMISLWLLLVSSAALSQAAPEIAAAVTFEGATYFKEQTLLRMITHRKGAAIDVAQLEVDARAISKNYLQRGFLHARVWPEVVRRGGQASVVFHIRPGERAKVRRLLVQGNVALSDQEALAGLYTKPDSLFGAFQQAGIFHAKRLDKDLQAVARNYYQRGYLEARVTGWHAYAVPASDKIDVTIDVVEGPLYRLGDIHFTGDLPDPEPELVADFGMARGDVADLVTLGVKLEKTLDRWRNRGYPFPRAEQSTQVEPADKLLNANFELLKEEKAQVGEIRLEGEPWTNRAVVIRDLEFKSGDWYDLSALHRSRDKLMESGLFMDVKLTPVRTTEPGKVDVNIALTERPGIIKDCIFNIAPAYFQSEGLIGIGLLMCPNFMGQGKRVSMIGQLSSLRQLFDLSVVEPRLLDTQLSLTADVHRRMLVYRLFSTNTLGGGVGLSSDLLWGLRGALSYDLEQVSVDPVSGMEAFAGSKRFPSGARRSAFTLRLSHDTRRGGLQPTGGMYHGVTLSTGGFWTLSDISFVELKGTVRYYVPLVYKALLKLNLSASTVFDPTGKPVVVSERYFPGGFGSVRGYIPRSLGPTRRFGNPSDPSAEAMDLQLGGIHEVVGNIEIEVPLISQLDIKGFVFLDAGNAFDETENFMLIGQWQDGREVPLPLGLYSSLGFGFLLPTGILPLRFEWSVPLTRRPGDQDLDFFFGVGGMF